MGRQVKIILPLLALAVSLASCTSSENKAVALQAISDFHRRYNNFAFSDIYEDAHPSLKSIISKEDFVSGIGAIRNGEGAVLDVQEVGDAYNYSSEGNMVKILVNVRFEKRKAREEFIYHVSTEKAYLSSYRFIPQ